MARYGSDQVAFLLVDGYSLLGVSTELEYEIAAVTEEVTPLGSAWEEHASVGLRQATLRQDGFYDDASASANEALVSQSGQARVVCLGVAGNAVGRRFTGFSGAMQADYRRLASRRQLHRAGASFQGSGQVDEGLVLHALGVETSASGNTRAAAVDNGAATAAGGAAYLQVPSLTLGGYTDLVVRVQHSADATTWADLATFSALAVAPAAERVVVAGTVNRYLAVAWTFNGAGSGQSVQFLVGFARF